MGDKPDQYDFQEGTALLEIVTDKGVRGLYWVYHKGRTTRIMKMSTKTVYALDLETGFCSCPDRATLCKHVKALRAVLRKNVCTV